MFDIKILKSILWRYRKYSWKIILSRHEYKKFWLTEWSMRKQLKLLRRNGLITVGKQYCWQDRFSNVYNISEELLEFIKREVDKVKVKFNVFKYNLEFDLNRIINNLRSYKKNYILKLEEDCKWTINTDLRIITRWCKRWWENKWYNLYNWLKKLW